MDCIELNLCFESEDAMANWERINFSEDGYDIRRYKGRTVCMVFHDVNSDGTCCIKNIYVC